MYDGRIVCAAAFAYMAGVMQSGYSEMLAVKQYTLSWYSLILLAGRICISLSMHKIYRLNV